MRRCLMLLIVLLGHLAAADHHTDVPLGVVVPGQNVNATATPPGTPLTGDVRDPGGWPWIKRSVVSYDATVPYSYAGTHASTFAGTYVVPGDQPGAELTWDMTATAQVPTVTVTVANATCELMDENTYTAIVDPPAIPVTSCEFFVARQGTENWESVSVTGASYTLKERVAGKLKVKCTAVVSSASLNSTNQAPFTVQFPHYTKLQTACQSSFDRYWQQTLAATTPTSRREQFSWIVIITNTGQIGTLAPVLGTPAGPTEGAGITPPPRPGDSIADPRPLVDRPVYIVGWFHTHTPTTFTTTGRPTGPSSADGLYSMDQLLPGFAYDYANGAMLGIPAGHPLNGPAQVYPIIPPERRPTP
ncbi:MAG: hypothetical protein J0M02_00520 [Planctomycetes bacterium]|nr:hypothetical protein [Planctomycetota bacterium]